MGCGKKAWAEEEEAEAWQRDLARIKEVKIDRILHLAQEGEKEITNLIRHDLSLTKSEHRIIDELRVKFRRVQGHNE